MSEGSTLRDVAKLAGVSVTTASWALNNKTGVSTETRARVLEAANTLRYQQQVRVPTVVVSQLSVIGFLIRNTPDAPMPGNPFYAHVLAGAEQECQRRGISMMYATVEVDQHNAPLALPPMLTDNRMDGVLIAGTFLSKAIASIRRLSDHPMVLVDDYAPDQQLDSVVTDNLNSAYNAVTYLIDQGHRAIGLIGSVPDAYPSIRERRKGYMRALQSHGIQQTYIEDGSLTRRDAFEATQRLLNRAPQITAIFACNDDVAIGVLNAAAALGLNVPADLSVIGFDNIELSQEIKPALTTMHIDKALMGSMAVRCLAERADGSRQTPLTIMLSTRLVVRDSVRARRVSD